MSQINDQDTGVTYQILTSKRPGLSRGVQWYPALSRDTDTKSRLEWIATLDRLETLQPKAVVAGHKIPENDDDPRIIGETREYLRDFDRLNTAFPFLYVSDTNVAI